MYIIALCGPLGAPIKQFANSLVEQLHEKNVASFAEEDYGTDPYQPDHEALLRAIRQDNSDVVIVDGHQLYTNEAFCRVAHVKIYLEIDEDSCLLQHLSNLAVPEDLAVTLANYTAKIKPINQSIMSISKRHADLIIPYQKDPKVVIDLLLSSIKTQTEGNELPMRKGNGFF